MKEIELRVSYFFAALAFVGCGSSAPTDFLSPDPGGGGAGAQQGGNGGSGLGGNAGAPQGGAGGSALGGSGGTAGSGAGGSTPLGGSAGSLQGGAAGSGLGGVPASGGTIAGGGNSIGGSVGARGGTGGSGVTSYACGTLMCVQGRQMCVHTLPEFSGGPQMYQCLEYPDNCSTVDCSCFCKGSQNDPCGSGTGCMCSGDPGRVTVVCGD